MGTIDISYLSLGIGLLLLLIPLFYIWKFKTGLLRATVIGTARMIVQLFFIGIYLNYLFLWDNPWINFLWVIVMIFVASQTALARTQLKRKILLLPISAGFLCSVVCVGLYFIGIVLRVENVFSAKQKDGYNQIWVDMYALTAFLSDRRAPTYADAESGERLSKVHFIYPETPD